MKEKLDYSELRTIDQVIGVPLGASGPKELLESTGFELSYVIGLHSKVRNLADRSEDGNIVDINFSTNEFKDLVRVYRAAVPLAKNFDDIHTLTGYEEEEVDALDVKLQNMIK